MEQKFYLMMLKLSQALASLKVVMKKRHHVSPCCVPKENCLSQKATFHERKGKVLDFQDVKTHTMSCPVFYTQQLQEAKPQTTQLSSEPQMQASPSIPNVEVGT